MTTLATANMRQLVNLIFLTAYALRIGQAIYLGCDLSILACVGAWLSWVMLATTKGL